MSQNFEYWLIRVELAGDKAQEDGEKRCTLVCAVISGWTFENDRKSLKIKGLENNIFEIDFYYEYLIQGSILSVDLTVVNSCVRSFEITNGQSPFVSIFINAQVGIIHGQLGAVC